VADPSPVLITTELVDRSVSTELQMYTGKNKSKPKVLKKNIFRHEVGCVILRHGFNFPTKPEGDDLIRLVEECFFREDKSRNFRFFDCRKQMYMLYLSVTTSDSVGTVQYSTCTVA
jgi:hypothetical protein